MTNTLGKHLTISDRLFIEEALLGGKSFQEIAINLGKHSTTIAKEVHKHRIADSKCFCRAEKAESYRGCLSIN